MVEARDKVQTDRLKGDQEKTALQKLEVIDLMPGQDPKTGEWTMAGTVESTANGEVVSLLQVPQKREQDVQQGGREEGHLGKDLLQPGGGRRAQGACAAEDKVLHEKPRRRGMPGHFLRLRRGKEPVLVWII